MKKYIYSFILLVFIALSCQPLTVEKDGGLRVTVQLEESDIGYQELIDLFHKLKGRVEYICQNNPVCILDTTNQEFIFELPLESDTSLIKELILSPGEFRIFEVYNNREFFEKLSLINKLTLENKTFGLIELSDGELKEFPLFTILRPAAFQNGELQNVGEIGYCIGKDTAIINSILSKPEIKSEFEKDVLFCWGRELKHSKNTFALYAIKKPTNYSPLDSDMISHVQLTINDVTGYYDVEFQVKNEFTNLWSTLTRRNIGSFLAASIDNTIYSCPEVRMQITDGRVSIYGIQKENETKMIAAFIKYGEINEKLRIKFIEFVGPKK